MNNLVEFKNNDLITTSKIIADGIGHKHKNVIQLIENHFDRIKNLRGILPFETEVKSTKNWKNEKRGQPQKYYLLDEVQATFLIALMRNSEIVLNFKESLIKEFFRMRKILLNLSVQKANNEYLETRNKGKISRLKETEIIKDFIEYAKKQGSKNAEKYYITLTNMENKALFLIEQKFKNIREILNINQLDEIKQADEIVLKALYDGMKEQMFYKDIYKLAKKRVELFSSLKGKSIVPSIEFKQLKNY